MSILTDQNRPITNYTTLWKMVENSAISTFCLLVQKKFLQYTYTLVTSLLIIWVIPLHTQLMGLYDRAPLSQQEQGALRGDLFVAQFLSSCHMVKIVTLQSRDRFQHGWMLTMEFKAHVKGLLKEVKDRIDCFSSALANNSPSFSLKNHLLNTISSPHYLCMTKSQICQNLEPDKILGFYLVAVPESHQVEWIMCNFCTFVLKTCKLIHGFLPLFLILLLILWRKTS